MIDFRYHLVSLVSVFLALAVGIALGAGPLQEPIQTTLDQQVDELRKEKDDLRRLLDTTALGLGNRDQYLRSITPALVNGQLGGRTVVLVVLPETDTDELGRLAEVLEAAGAKVTARVDVQQGWTDPTRLDDREDLATRLRSVLPAGTPGTGARDQEVDATLGALLARAVTTGDLSQSEQSDAVSKRVLDELDEAGLAKVDGDFGGRATEAVLLVPAVDLAVEPGATPNDSPTARVEGTWTALAAALDAGSDGAVVLGPASSATSGGVVAAVREDGDISELVSTVDTGGTPMGDVTTVLALREQQLGGTGKYGFGDGATRPFPPQVLPATP